jgi:hypothetical protein
MLAWNENVMSYVIGLPSASITYIGGLGAYSSHRLCAILPKPDDANRPPVFKAAADLFGVA